MSLGFEKLNLDILFIVVKYLDLEDVLRLGWASRRWTHWILDESVCRNVIQTHVPFSEEAGLAVRGQISYRQAHEAIYRRWMSLRSASTVSASRIGYGSSLVLDSRRLYYVDCSGYIHIIQVDEPTTSEVVARLPHVPNLQENPDHSCKLLSCKDNIITYEHSICGRPHLVCAEIDVCQSLTDARLISWTALNFGTRHVFARQTKSHVVYGIFPKSSKARSWQIHIFSIESGKKVTPVSPSISLDGFDDVNIGSSTTFGIHKSHFYAVTVRNRRNNNPLDDVSLYDCIRISLCDPSLCERRKFFRKRHSDGPVHDLWTDLRLEVDERCDRLCILETRRIWVNCSSRQQRSAHICPLDFDDNAIKISTYPNLHQKLMSINDNPTCYEPDDYLVQHDSSERQFTSANTKFRHYDLSSRTFLDVVLDTCSRSQKPHIRLRICSDQPPNKHLNQAQHQNQNQNQDQYQNQHQNTIMFPPDSTNIQNTDVENTNMNASPDTLSLFELSSRNLEIECLADKRSLVYLVREPGMAGGSIVYVDFMGRDLV